MKRMTVKIRTAFAALIIFGGLVIGFGVTLTPARAQITITPSECTNCPYGSPLCVTFGLPEISTEAIKEAFKQILQEMIDSYTNWFANMYDQFIGSLLTGINDTIEGQFIQWQDNWVNYDLVPAMKDKMDQINTAYIDSSRSFNSGIDGAIHNRTIHAIQEIESDAFVNQLPSSQICVSATLAGSNFARANTLMRAFRKASERMFTHRGSVPFTLPKTELAQSHPPQEKTDLQISSSRFSPGIEALNDPAFEKFFTKAALPSYAAGPTVHAGYQWDRYCRFLAKDIDNGEDNRCPDVNVPAVSQGMDVNPTKYLFNSFVIDITDPAIAKGLEAMKENLAGLTPPDLIPATALRGAPGRQKMLDQRSYIARQNAARSVIEFISSQRTPAADVSDLVHELRESVGVPLTGINPDKTSYKEIMNALSTEKFASGTYNLNMVGEVENVKRESLLLSVFYLMQLRDYYELMERAVLTLAVQTSIELGAETSGDEGG